MGDDDRGDDQTDVSAMGEGDIEIGVDEWGAVMRCVLPAIDDDERSSLGHMCLRQSDGRRRWIGTDSYRAVVLDVGATDVYGDVLVPLRLLRALPLAAGGSPRATLRVGSGEGSTVAMLGPGGSTEMDRRTWPFPDVETILVQHREEAVASVVVDVEALREVLTVARNAPLGEMEREDFVAPAMQLETSPGRLSLAVDWGDFGKACSEIAATGEGSASVLVNPGLLAEILGGLDPGELTLELPPNPRSGLVISQGPMSGILMPLDPSRPASDRVKAILGDLFGMDALVPDADGDFQLTTYGVPVYARILELDPVQLRLLAVVVDAVPVESTALRSELLDEINQVNLSLGFAKVVLVESQVLVVGDLVAETVDPEEIGTLFENVRDVANGLGPAFGARFGGTAQTPDEDLRWVDYANAVIAVELLPGAWVDLTGTDALDEWPFEDPVHVVTAHDPLGRVRSDEANAEANGRLAGELAEAGLGFARAIGGSADGEISEESFLIWGATLDDVRRLGREFDQEAVFEITDDEVSAVSSYTDKRVSRARRG